MELLGAGDLEDVLLLAGAAGNVGTVLKGDKGTAKELCVEDASLTLQDGFLGQLMSWVI